MKSKIVRMRRKKNLKVIIKFVCKMSDNADNHKDWQNILTKADEESKNAQIEMDNANLTPSRATFLSVTDIQKQQNQQKNK